MAQPPSAVAWESQPGRLCHKKSPLTPLSRRTAAYRERGAKAADRHYRASHPPAAQNGPSPSGICIGMALKMNRSNPNNARRFHGKPVRKLKAASGDVQAAIQSASPRSTDRVVERVAARRRSRGVVIDRRVCLCLAFRQTGAAGACGHRHWIETGSLLRDGEEIRRVFRRQWREPGDQGDRRVGGELSATHRSP